MVKQTQKRVKNERERRMKERERRMKEREREREEKKMEIISEKVKREREREKFKEKKLVERNTILFIFNHFCVDTLILSCYIPFDHFFVSRISFPHHFQYKKLLSIFFPSHKKNVRFLLLSLSLSYFLFLFLSLSLREWKGTQESVR